MCLFYSFLLSHTMLTALNNPDILHHREFGTLYQNPQQVTTDGHQSIGVELMLTMILTYGR